MIYFQDLQFDTKLLFPLLVLSMFYWPTFFAFVFYLLHPNLNLSSYFPFYTILQSIHSLICRNVLFKQKGKESYINIRNLNQCKSKSKRVLGLEKKREFACRGNEKIMENFKQKIANHISYSTLFYRVVLSIKPS